MIVKSSRDETFVFAQNMATGKPWPNARILVSNGTEVFAEGTTGKDGVLHEGYKQLKSSGDIRVFAVDAGHVASNVVNLQGVGTARGLSSRGYVYTERPAYRAGQVVHVRGILRKVDGDTYTVAKEKKYQVDIFDNRNRLLHDAKIALNDFGSFHTHFQLPASTPAGQYRIVVHDDDKESYPGTFVVHEYQLEPIRLEIDTERTVFYRGEEIVGKIRASFYYGAPLVGREIRYQLAGGRSFSAKTDDKGEVEIKLPTREYRESQMLPLSASLPERNLRTAKNFFLATQGFGITLNTQRSLFLAGDTFDVTLTTRDAEGEAISKALILSVLRQTNVQVSDDSDTVRLRVLADKHTLKVGDVANANIHWREAPALALVTFQGAKILDYKLVRLKKGANKLPIPMTAKLAPNFALSVCVMTDVRDAKPGDKRPVVRFFHEASSSFRVHRELLVDIAMKPKKKGAKLRPGDEVEVTITTTDPQGKPVSAEVGLAMIEQSLLARYGQNVESIQDFFRSSPRVSAMRTTASITFNYRPSTRGINTRLLAERTRLELEGEERDALRRAGELIAAEPAGPPVEEGVDFDVTVENGAVAGGAFSGALDRPAVPFDSNSEVDMKFAEKSSSQAKIGDAKQQLVLDALVSLDQSSASFDEGVSLGLPSGEIVQNWDGDGLLITETLAANNRGVMQTITSKGTWAFVQLAEADGKFEPEKALVRLQKLEAAGTVLLPNLRPHETGYWNPAIATDKKGKATVTFLLPDRSTAWKLLAKGITVDTLAGEDDDEFSVKKDLFGQLKLPTAFTDGDVAEIIASVHNDLLEKGKINVTLKTTVGKKTSSETQTLDIKKKGIRELVFKTTLNLPPAEAKKGSPREAVQFELTVAAADTKDVVNRTVPLRPYGLPVFSVAGGSASSDMTAFLEPPKGMALSAPSLQVILGPTVERSLLDVVLAPAPWCQLETGRIASGSDRAVSDLMAALALQKLISESQEKDDPQATALDNRVRASVSLLISMQNNDGGWSWTGSTGTSNRYNTARVTWALHLAKKSGYRVPADTCNKALNFIRTQIAKTQVTDYETKAVLLHALAVAGVGDFPLANQLYRNRPALSSAGLVHLVLAFVEMDRKQTAEELLNVLATRNLDDTTPRKRAVLSPLPWSHAPAELRALYALALSRVNPKDARLKKQIDWLMAHRTGHRWAPEKATGPAMLVACDWFARTRFDSQKYQLTIWVNDLKAKVVEIDKSSLTRTIDIPAKLLAKKGKQRIRLEITGRGRYSYQCVLGGFVPADKLASTTQDWRVNRYYTPAPLEMDGTTIPRGFNVLQGNYTTFRNDLSQLPVARRGQVELQLHRYNIPSGTPSDHLEYLVITEPLPAGVTVVENSVKGGFERFEIGPDAITFYVGGSHGGTIRYDVHGYLPGKYRAAPTVVRNAYAADQIAVAKSKSLDVLALGAKSKDVYRLSPRELYELGKRTFDKKDYAASAKHLGELLSKWNLADQYYKDSARMLLDVHLAKGPSADVVRYFEIVIQKLPELEISFSKLVKIGDAYHEIGEYERSYLVFRATIEGSFFRESQVAGFLEGQGEFLRSVDVMDSLTREYPPEAYLASATYALAQRVYAKAPEAAGDAKLREVKINRVNLIRQSLGMLDAFLTSHPDDPAADEASFSLASAHLDLDAYEEAIAAATKFATRYPESTFVDSFWYIIGYCHYARGEHKQALAMCDKVAKATQKDPRTGREKESPNKWQAIYILGQIHHSLGKAQDAIREYTRVKDRFVDARQAIEFFAHKDIKLPEVTTIKPGEAATVELKFRNVPTCDTKVYRIDLMKFGLLKRNLGGITKINLAGIRPFHEVKTELGDGKDFRDRQADLKLPLKEIGAYLVVSRAENLHTSGLVLVTPLDVKVHEDPESGRIRTTVKDVVKDTFVPDVHVKVIGSSNQDFSFGETDLRGIFVADDIRGKSTVIALAGDDQYAFYRGKLALGPQQPSASQTAPAKPKSNATKSKQKEELLRNLKSGNYRIQEQQKQQLEDLYENDINEGVKNFQFK